MLLTFSPMINTELCRFVLAHHGRTYREASHLIPWVNMLALWHGWHIRVPLLYGDGHRLAGPLRIIRHFNNSCPPELKLIPSEKQLSDQVAAGWDRFNETFGMAVAVFAYYHLLPHRKLMLEPLSRGMPAGERRFFEAHYATITGGLKSYLRLNADHAQQSLGAIRSTFDETDKLLKDGRRYLVGDRLTLSDITLATSAAPILLPAGYDPPMPPFHQLPSEVVSVITEMRQHETARFVERIYRDHRKGHRVGEAA